MYVSIVWYYDIHHAHGLYNIFLLYLLTTVLLWYHISKYNRLHFLIYPSNTKSLSPNNTIVNTSYLLTLRVDAQYKNAREDLWSQVSDSCRYVSSMKPYFLYVYSCCAPILCPNFSFFPGFITGCRWMFLFSFFLSFCKCLFLKEQTEFHWTKFSVDL